ncbi:hypothetical protein C2E23DRAFT_858563 [Lenzites betulinus]|nr:hypothetical protein C2E23DRAFT_858563 [Lenzites betulinus]
MGWRTYFRCDRVEVTTARDIRDNAVVVDLWKPARLFLSESLEQTRWLLVTVEGDRFSPAIWHAIKDGWSIICDEETLTVIMHGLGGVGCEVLTRDKLRFTTPKDFWGFIAHYSLGRVHANPTL